MINTIDKVYNKLGATPSPKDLKILIDVIERQEMEIETKDSFIADVLAFYHYDMLGLMSSLIDDLGLTQLAESLSDYSYTEAICAIEEVRASTSEEEFSTEEYKQAIAIINEIQF